MIPTDYYYSSLEGPSYNQKNSYDGSPLHDWDLDDNGYYVELYKSSNYDGFDICGLSVSVGRAPVGGRKPDGTPPVPVDCEKEADNFVNKIINYEQYRDSNGISLNPEWASQVLYVSSNWIDQSRFWVEPLPPDTSPSPLPKYNYRRIGSNMTLLNVGTDINSAFWKVIIRVNSSDFRNISADIPIFSSNRGWYYVISESDLRPSVMSNSLGFSTIISTQWIVVYSDDEKELTPEGYIIDNPEADCSMNNEEILRKQTIDLFGGLNCQMRLYEDMEDLPTSKSDPRLMQLDRDNFLNQINSGTPHLISLSGHGASDSCCQVQVDSVSSVNTNDITSMTNYDRPFILWANSCLTGYLESDLLSLSKELVKYPKGGAVAYIGFSRMCWWNIGIDLPKMFFSTLGFLRYIGLANDSRVYVASINDEPFKWSLFAINLNGDPETSAWIGAPFIMNVTHPTVIKRKQSFAVNVKCKWYFPISDKPYVHLQCDGQSLGRYADNFWGGDVVFTAEEIATILNENLLRKQKIEVTVTNRGFQPYLGEVVYYPGFLPAITLLISSQPQ